MNLRRSSKKYGEADNLRVFDLRKRYPVNIFDMYDTYVYDFNVYIYMYISYHI